MEVGSGTRLSIADLLTVLGWTEIIAADPLSRVPEDGRDTYQDELLIDRFRESVRVINPGPDRNPWLDQTRLDLICDRVRQIATMPDLVEANKASTELLLSGLVVPGLAEEDGRGRRVRLVDWDEPARNDLRVVRNFRLDRPVDGGAPWIILDYVLFVNGLPLAVIRDPAPDREATVGEAIADLRSYTGARQDGPRESVPRFFGYAQVLVATDGIEHAKLGTITSPPEYFTEWKTVEPAQAARIRTEFGVSSAQLTSLERLIVGVLRPAHLLNIVRNFTAFRQTDDRVVKLVARYSQFRAVHRIVDRLRNGIPGAPGRRDERGGVVWHTQGSGKSYTMAFLIRKLRSTPDLQDFKVVVAVDRVNLRDQLSDSLALADETVHEAGGVAHARQLLSDGVPDVVLIMMQHAQRDEDAAIPDQDSARLGADVVDDRIQFPELTRSHRVIVIADEAHRSQGGWLRARLRRGLPAAAWIGFTGTPLTREDKRRGSTTGIFGDFFDIYRLADAVADHATVPIRYEQRLAATFIVDRVSLDAEYEREVGGTAQERQSAQDKWLTTRHALESEELIAAKARDMLRHWMSTVLPNGFKAQVAGATRLAAVRYRAALLQARDDLVAELAAYGAAKDSDPLAARAHPDHAFLDAALPFEALLRVIDFVPVISAGGDRADPDTGQTRRDPPEWAQWTAETARRRHIDGFKERLPAPETIGTGEPQPSSRRPEPWADTEPEPERPRPSSRGPWADTQPDDNMRHVEGSPWSDTRDLGPGPAPIAFVIVQAMLLTGFDAPVEQVLYLDRPIRDVELLQAIARVNRPARLKTIGLVVDYVGVSRHLDRALAVYDDEDIAEAKTLLEAEDVPRLRAARDNVQSFLAGLGISSLRDTAQVDRLLVALENPRLRVEFDDLLREFFLYLDRVLPREEALRYEDDARTFGAAQYRVRSCFRDTRSGSLDPFTYGAKVRRLIDEHLRAIGIAQRIPPVEITAADFQARVAALSSPRVRALEMEHAIRRHVAEYRASDPDYYEQLSDRLDRLLEQLRDDAEQLAAALDALIQELRQRERTAAGDDLDPRTERPIHSILETLLREDMAEGRARASMVSVDVLYEITRTVAVEIEREVSPPHFLTSGVLQERLRRMIYATLTDTDLYSGEAAGRAAQRILAFARANRDFYLRRGEPHG